MKTGKQKTAEWQAGNAYSRAFVCVGGGWGVGAGFFSWNGYNKAK